MGGARAEEDDAERLSLVEDREDAHRAEGDRVLLALHDVEERVLGRVGHDEQDFFAAVIFSGTRCGHKVIDLFPGENRARRGGD